VPAFFDTNVLVYCTDTGAPAKRTRARNLVAAATTAGEAVISTQVLIELFNVLTRKQKMPAATAQALVLAYAAWPVVASDMALVEAAMEKSIEFRLSIWDAMVIEGATRVQAEILFSEDLSHGRRFGALEVVNPFMA
jgi:predicted nucleic acid-binding protein